MPFDNLQRFDHGKATGLKFVHRRCMLQDVDRAGRKVRRWSGWHLVEAYDCNTGLPYGVYFQPPAYEDFAFVYIGSQAPINKKIYDRWEDTRREISDDVVIDPAYQLGSGVTAREITGII